MTKFLRSISFLLVAAAAAVACGNSDDDESTTTDGGGGGGPTPTGGGSCTPPADECTLLTTSEAATAINAPGTMTTAEMMGPGDPSIDEPAHGTCGYTSTDPSDSADQIVVSYICGFDSTAASSEQTAFKALVGGGEAVAVSGVGSDAVWEETSSAPIDDGGTLSGGAFYAITGNGYITIEILGYGTATDLEMRAMAAAKLVISRL